MATVLHAVDYVIIFAMMAISTAIGIFFAVRAGRRQSSNDYFLGSRQMSVIPVSLSLAATVMSAITYLGTPAEIYLHGPKFAMGLLSRVAVPFTTAYFFVPVYYRLKVTTMYEYLGLRFNSVVRYSVVIAKFIHEFLYMGIVIYTPALALSLVAGISLSLSILSVGVVCTVYTSIGGIKAVIWTDVFQAMSMLLGASVMIIVGTARIGGAAEGWRRAVEGSRGELFDFSVDPTVRFTFWSTVFGGSFGWMFIGCATQSQIQRYNSCRNEKEAQIASCLGLIGMAVIELLAIITGMTAFAYFYDCDPLTSDMISRPDQIVPFFIMDLFHHYPGVPGILIGGAFCASLSSMSSVLNGIVAAVGQDVVKKIWPDMSDLKYALIVKMLSFLFGALAIILAFLASVLGNVLTTAMSIGGVLGGPVLGVFILGMFFPRANSEGALAGIIGSVSLGLVQYIGSQVYPSYRHPLPLSVDGCAAGINTTSLVEVGIGFTDSLASLLNGHVDSEITTTALSYPESPVQSPSFFNLSYLYISAMTTLACVTIGVVVSYATSWGNPRVIDSRLLTPIVARYFGNTRGDSKQDIATEKEYVSLKQV